jgi:dihydrofolate synthase/folylpolyglutamate synthase
MSANACSVITIVAFDHMDYLGDTLESIAYEKAGIIKQHGVCITAAKQKAVLSVLKDVCLRRRAKLYCVGRDIKIKKEKNGLITYQGIKRHLKKLKSPLRGEHQLDNLALALAIIECCEQNGLRVADKAILQGLARRAGKPD